MQHFINKFGLPHSQEFRQAQQNFASSLAGYAVACHILSIKDRHNGNILFTEDGHMCHIDYGFLLGISPGGNLGFENASFKLTGEMLELLGGPKSELFSTFMSMTIRGFLAARQVMEPLLIIVAAMADSGLPCFMHKADNLAKLRARFVPELSDTDAAVYMKGRVLDAKNKWTTRAYDGIQKLQQNIYSDTWL
jgi:phosphatidylinositol 4-kinase